MDFPKEGPDDAGSPCSMDHNAHNPATAAFALPGLRADHELLLKREGQGERQRQNAGCVVDLSLHDMRRHVEPHDFRAAQRPGH